MKNTAVLICLLVAVNLLHAAEPVTIKRQGSADNTFIASASRLNLKSNFIYPAWGFYVDVAPGFSKINNNNLNSDISGFDGGFGYLFTAGYFQSLSPWFKFKTGIGLSGYTSTFLADGTIPSTQFRDVDNDPYLENLTLNNVEQKTSPLYLSVPLILEFGNPNISKIGFYFDLGLKYSYLVNDNLKSSGTYSTSGTYEQWGVTLEDIPELGFYSSKQMESDVSLKKSNYSVIAGAGVYIPVNTVVILKAGITSNWGLADIGGNVPEKPAGSPLSHEVYNYRAQYIDNSFAVAEGSRTRFIGIEFGLYISHLLK